LKQLKDIYNMKKFIFILLVIATMGLQGQTPYYVNQYGDVTGKADVGVILTTAIDAGETVLRFSPGRYKITTDVDIPAGVTLVMDRGALIDARDTITGVLTHIEAGYYQIFTRSSKLAGTWDVDKVPVDWFGATAEFIANDLSIEVDTACTFASKTTGKTALLRNQYNIGRAMTMPAGITLEFSAGAGFLGTCAFTGSQTRIQGTGQLFPATFSFAGSFAGSFVDNNWFAAGADYTTFCGLTTLSTAVYTNVDVTLLSGAEADPKYATDSAKIIWWKDTTAVGPKGIATLADITPKINKADSNTAGSYITPKFVSTTYSPIASPTFSGLVTVASIKVTSSDTSTAAVGKIIYNAADSSFYGCRSTTATKKWYKINP
jgi:hypothetical protein